jgi:hypothetical protein
MNRIHHLTAEVYQSTQRGVEHLGDLGRRAVRMLRNEDPRMATSLRILGIGIMLYSRGLKYSCSTSVNPFSPDQCRMLLDTISNIGELVLLVSFSKTPFFRRFAIFVP